MGRWGHGIYESDSALDYFATISDVLEREINYWCLPEKVMNNAGWLAEVLSVVEVMLLFDLHDMGSTVYIDTPQAVARWREAFFRVWDGDWKADERYRHLPYNEPAYRQQHRPGAAALFDHLDGIAQDWATPDRENSHAKSAPLHPDYPLPYFSLLHVTNRKNEIVPHVAAFTRSLIDAHVQEITYWLAYERWQYVNEDKIPAAVDVLGFLCEIYEQRPGINDEVARSWRAAAIRMWRDSIGEDWGKTDPMYQSIVKAFDRLESVAKKYPPYEW